MLSAISLYNVPLIRIWILTLVWQENKAMTIQYTMHSMHMREYALFYVRHLILRKQQTMIC